MSLKWEGIEYIYPESAICNSTDEIVNKIEEYNHDDNKYSEIAKTQRDFAKENYTMLDNLKLGYGGTKEEMARLIADAAALSDTVDAQSMSFDNIVEAIHVVQTEMGITGTTAKRHLQQSAVQLAR